MDASRHHTVSLTVEVTLVAAFVTAAGMAVYGVIQYFTGPGHTVTGLILHHSWHVVVLGGLTYVVLYAALARHVMRPIRTLFLKCYAITKGDLGPVEVDTRVQEIQVIADGINMVLDRIRKTEPQIASGDLVSCAEGLRSIATDPDNHLTSGSEDFLLEAVARIECAAAANGDHGDQDPAAG